MAAMTSGGASVEIISQLSRLCNEVIRADKGVLAFDDSVQSLSFLFGLVDLPNEEEYRRLYRQIMFSSHDLELYFSSALITEEAFFQSDDEAEGFNELLMSKGLLLCVRADLGPGIGLDGLGDRIESLRERGASMLRWKGVFKVGDDPKRVAGDMARFAAITQAFSLLPVVSVDLLAEGNHSLNRARRHLELVLASVVKSLHDLNVSIEAVILIVPLLHAGCNANIAHNPKHSAAAIVDAMLETLPPVFGGVLFSSSGLSEELATNTLNSIAKLKSRCTPWKMSFAFGRAQQVSFLTINLALISPSLNIYFNSLIIFNFCIKVTMWFFIYFFPIY